MADMRLADRQELESNNFDSDVRDSVGVLVKYLDNIIGRPDEPKTRAIRSEQAFRAGATRNGTGSGSWQGRKERDGRQLGTLWT